MARTAEDIVRTEVHYCVSSLVAALAGGFGVTIQVAHSTLVELTEQAFELASPIADYEEAATQAGWRLIASDAGSETWQKGDGDDADFAAGAVDACYGDNIEPYDREVFEHWIVSDWLADKLAEKGEKVDKDFAGLTVWARTTTGQAIAADWVIEQIAADLAKGV